MNAKKISFFAVFLVAVIALAAFGALADPVDIEELTVTVNEIEAYHAEWDESIPGINSTTFKQVDNIALTRGDRVPVKVQFTVGDTEELGNVRVRVAIFGYRYDITDTSERFHAYPGKTYVKTLYLDLPEDMDTDNDHKDYSLYVGITDSTTLSGIIGADIPVDVQRESFKLDALNVEVGRINGCCLPVALTGEPGICGECYESVSAGEKIAIDVVVKNMGQDEQEDVWVEASIPGLCTSRKVYVGDIYSHDGWDYEDYPDIGYSDVAEATIYLSLPADMKAGAYDLVIRAWSDDSEVESTEKITVTEAESEAEGASEVYASNTRADVNKGETVAYRLTIVNVGEKAKTYTVGVSGAESWSDVEVTPSVIRLDGDASAEVIVYVTVDEDAVAGDHVFTVAVYSDGETVSEYNLISSVEGKEAKQVDVKVALLIAAIILAVVIVVLLIILIARMASKGSEEVPEETAYY